MKKLFKSSTIERLTKYDIVKKTKKENFSFLNRQACEKGQIVFAGDSITEIFNITDLFSSFCKRTGLAIYNRGISGDTSDRLAERIKENVTVIEPCVVVLLIGTNDLGIGCEIGFTLENVKFIIETIKAECPNAKIILQSVYPVNENINRRMVGRRRNKTILQLNALLEELAAKQGIVYLDLTDALSDDGGFFKKEYTYDGLHPNAAGFKVVSEKLLTVLE